ncbi:hypothetical protein ACIQOV_38695 [Kitasatospora sp. NPDC091257]|uniref:hypothetical protein n=1 Tax=Kitasatospora sp. NPDC091257 TaxID=3364084 RepID=UPI00381CDDB9
MATRALLAVRDNLADTIAARAMMCIHGGAGFGKTVAVTSCLRELEPGEDIHRITFHTRPTTRAAVRHELFISLGLPGSPPTPAPSSWTRPSGSPATSWSTSASWAEKAATRPCARNQRSPPGSSSGSASPA